MLACSRPKKAGSFSARQAAPPPVQKPRQLLYMCEPCASDLPALRACRQGVTHAGGLGLPVCQETQVQQSLIE